MECAPCAVAAWRQRNGPISKGDVFWSSSIVDAVLDIAISSLLVSGAHEVLIPYSLMRYLDHQDGYSSWLKHCRSICFDTGSKSTPNSILERWEALKSCSSNVVVLLNSHRELEEFLCMNHKGPSQGITFQNVAIPVPSGPIACKVLFPGVSSINAFYATILPDICRMMRQHGMGVRWIAWMRASLSCRFEGDFISPIRLGDYTASLLRESSSASVENTVTYDTENHSAASRVVWEESIANALTSRWLETIMKTSVACGVPLSKVSLSLCNNSVAGSSFLAKAVEGSISNFTSCSIPHPLFEYADVRLTLPALQERIIGINEFSMSRGCGLGLDSSYWKEGQQQDEMVLLEKSNEWMQALHSTWISLPSSSTKKGRVPPER